MRKNLRQIHQTNNSKKDSLNITKQYLFEQYFIIELF
jgi:hypothetical protein